MIICPHCGIRNRTDSNFCNNCGADLRTGESRASKPGDSPAETNETTGSAQTETDSDTNLQGDDLSPPAPTGAATEDLPESAVKGEPEAGDASTFWRPPDAATSPTQEDQREEVSFAAADGVREGLITGVHGLLPPHTVSSATPGAPSSDEAIRATAAGEILAAGQFPSANVLAKARALDEVNVRRLRRSLLEEPALTRTPLRLATQNQPTLHIPWIFWLLGLCLLLAYVFRFSDLPGSSPPLPGVQAAYNQIENTAASSPILVWWGYDPATAGEMDLVMLPLLRHLLARQHQLFLFSGLPTGVATAERLFKRLDDEVNTERSASIMRSADYLPGGPAVLPLIGQHFTAAARDATNQGRVNANPAAAAPATLAAPALVLVVAAQAEDVQQWLEQVQPRNQLPVLAITGAAADPILRPYWNSGQLVGLVSGVDGGLAYEALLSRTEAANTATAPPRLSQFAVAARYQMVQMQNWGHIAFLLIILLGNLTILVNRGR